MTSSLNCYRSFFNKHLKNFYSELETELKEESVDSFSVNFDIFVKEQNSWVNRPELKSKSPFDERIKTLRVNIQSPEDHLLPKPPMAVRFKGAFLDNYAREIEETIDEMALDFFKSDDQEKYISAVNLKLTTIEIRSKTFTFPLKELSPTCDVCGLWRTTAQKIERCLCPTYYCGIEHQKEGWKTHKFQCSPLKTYRSYIDRCFLDFKEKLILEIDGQMVESFSIGLNVYTKKKAIWKSTPVRQSKKPIEERMKNLQPEESIDPVLDEIFKRMQRDAGMSPLYNVTSLYSNYEKEIIETIDAMVENFFNDCTEEKYISKALVIISFDEKSPIKNIPLELKGPHCNGCDKWMTTSQKITKCADSFYCSLECQTKIDS